MCRRGVARFRGGVRLGNVEPSILASSPRHMAIAASLLPEFDHEMRTTRSLLAAVPDDRAGWTPHPKSMSLGALAVHLPGLLRWIPGIVRDTELDVTGAAAQRLHLAWQSGAATLAAFDSAVAEGRAAIAAAPDEVLMVPWTLRAASHTIVTMPRVAVFRTLVMNHIIHHRGQLSVYLRLNDVALPEIYGPTADSAR